MYKFTFLLCYLVAAFSFAQVGIISGKVLEQSTGSPLLGATVQYLTTKQATTTDFDGLFTVAASPGEILKISYLVSITHLITFVYI